MFTFIISSFHFVPPTPAAMASNNMLTAETQSEVPVIVCAIRKPWTQNHMFEAGRNLYILCRCRFIVCSTKAPRAGCPR